MMNEARAVPILRNYVALQERLCGALFHEYPVADRVLLTDLPRRGLLRVDSDEWEFVRHGAGVRFFCRLSKETVDVHVEPVACPGGVDAWRLILYLESRGIRTVECNGERFNATSEPSLEEMLKVLCREGLLVVSDPRRHVYSLHSSSR